MYMYMYDVHSRLDETGKKCTYMEMYNVHVKSIQGDAEMRSKVMVHWGHAFQATCIYGGVFQ